MPDLLTVVIFFSAVSLVVLAALLLTGRNQRLEGRIQQLAGNARPIAQQDAMAEFTRTMLPKLGARLMPESDKQRSRLKSRLIYAGLYSPRAMAVFLAVRLILMLVPLVIALLLWVAGVVPMTYATAFATLGFGLGALVPNFWLDSRKTRRQTIFQRTLPDALDMIVICLKAGLSLQSAFQRIAAEATMIHPLLALELNINQREMQMGRTIGEALRHFADRTDLEELRNLATVVSQAERLGASAVQSMKVHAESLRIKRLQRAEELAQKASTKIVFPTILCIFPAIFIVVLGPAVFQINDLFSQLSP